MSTEYPQIIYYYAIRDPGCYYSDPQRNVPRHIVQEWNIVLLVQSSLLRANSTIYIPDEIGIEQRYFIHHIPFVDFDLLTAFDVPSVVGFEIKYWRIQPRK